MKPRGQTWNIYLLLPGLPQAWEKFHRVTARHTPNHTSVASMVVSSYPLPDCQGHAPLDMLVVVGGGPHVF
jgi:hypothetical protein